MNKERKDAINEVIATKLFGLVEGKDYGEWPEHDWIRQCDDYLEATDYEDMLKQNTPRTRAESPIDIWAYEVGYCNGPRCARCGEEFCKHCEYDRWERIEDGEPDGPCVVPIPDYFQESWFMPLMKKFLEEYGDEYTLEFRRSSDWAVKNLGLGYRVCIRHVVVSAGEIVSWETEASTMQEALVETIFSFLNAQ